MKKTLLILAILSITAGAYASDVNQDEQLFKVQSGGLIDPGMIGQPPGLTGLAFNHVTDDQVEISWESMSHDASYSIFINGKLIETTTSTYFVGQPQKYYLIVANNKDGFHIASSEVSYFLDND
ncbi:MAG: hypothetical protein ACI936_003252 [Paraglaciecola sp.]|jgi:hypothetical protein